jgi:hypothetical protein
VSGQLHAPVALPRGRAPGTHWIGGWLGPRTGLDDVERRKILSLPGLEFRPLGRPAHSQSLYQWLSNGAGQEVARCAANIMKLYFNKEFWHQLIASSPWYYTGHIENDSSNNASIFACVFGTAVTFLPSHCLATTGEFLLSRCLATKGGFLLSRCLATIWEGYTDTHT